MRMEDSQRSRTKDTKPSNAASNTACTSKSKRPENNNAWAESPSPSIAIQSAPYTDGADVQLRPRITKADIANLQPYTDARPIRVVSDVRAVKEAVEEILHLVEPKATDPLYLGFDTETRPSFVKGRPDSNPPALLQIGTHQAVYLFQLIPCRRHIASLIPLLNCPKVVFLGVSIAPDIRDLQTVALDIWKALEEIPQPKTSSFTTWTAQPTPYKT